MHVITRAATETCHWPWTTSEWNSVVSQRKCWSCCSCCCQPCAVADFAACSLLLGTNGQLTWHRQDSTATMASSHWNRAYTYIHTNIHVNWISNCGGCGVGQIIYNMPLAVMPQRGTFDHVAAQQHKPATLLGVYVTIYSHVCLCVLVCVCRRMQRTIGLLMLRC